MVSSDANIPRQGPSSLREGIQCRPETRLAQINIQLGISRKFGSEDWDINPLLIELDYYPVD